MSPPDFLIEITDQSSANEFIDVLVERRVPGQPPVVVTYEKAIATTTVTSFDPSVGSQSNTTTVTVWIEQGSYFDINGATFDNESDYLSAINIRRADPSYISESTRSQFSSSPQVRKYRKWEESQIYLKEPEIKDYFTGYYLDSKQYKCLCNIKYKSNLKGELRISWQELTGEIQQDASGVNTPTVDTYSRLLKIDKDWVNFTRDIIPCSMMLTGDAGLIQEIKNNLSVSSSSNWDAIYILFSPASLSNIKSSWMALHANEVSNAIANLPGNSSLSTSSIQNKRYVWAANNNRWGNTRIRSNLNTGTGIGENVSAQWLYDKYLEPKSDGTYGAYTMPDSARLVELHHYLVGNNATYIDANGDTKPNQFTAWWQIKNIARVLGLRRDNELKIDRPSEKKILRDRLNNPKYDDNDYSIACWGDEGMCVPFLPTEYDAKTGQLQERYDIVHDFAQLLAAYHEQVDRADPIRLGAEIRVKRGDKIASYPNKLSLLIDTADRIAKIEQMMERLLLAGLVSSNEIREMWTGIGIPITHKSLPVEVDGKKQLLPYVGHQAGKPTLIDRLSEIAMNIAIQTGQLMPRKSSVKTPFDRFLPPKQKK